MTSAVLALLAAALYGTGVALQQAPAAARPEQEALHPEMLLQLARSRRWLLGMVADLGGFALQAAALHRGALVVVQPLLTLSLVFALGIAAALTHDRVRTRDWASVVLVLAGLMIFLAAGGSSAESGGTAPPSAWIGSAVGVIVTVTAITAVSRRRHMPAKAIGLGLAAGVAEAFMATMAKAFSSRLGSGLGATFLSWEPYALASAGLLTVLVVQSAYQVGRPTLTLPVMSATDPIVGVIIGVTVFEEHVQLAGVHGLGVLVAAVLMIVGISELGRTPALVHDAAPASSGSHP